MSQLLSVVTEVPESYSRVVPESAKEVLSITVLLHRQQFESYSEILTFTTGFVSLSDKF